MKKSYYLIVAATLFLFMGCGLSSERTERLKKEAQENGKKAQKSIDEATGKYDTLNDLFKNDSVE